jgi:hypothetical protein
MTRAVEAMAGSADALSDIDLSGVRLVIGTALDLRADEIVVPYNINIERAEKLFLAQS